MAAYTGTPTVLSAYELGDRYNKRVAVVRRLSLVLAAQGGATNTISAASLGFAAGQIFKADCCLFTDGGLQKRTVWCFTDGSYLYIGDPTQATDANRAIPADVTGTLVVEVTGLPV